MAYVPSYEHDVFVSYAHVDDGLEPGETKGWVTNLVLSLKNRLAQKLGRSDELSVFMDHELLGHASLSRQIIGTLERSATLVVILSPGYIASSWCQREASAFLSHIATRRQSSSQIFVVRRDKIDGTEPKEFGDLVGYRFWVQDNLGTATHVLGTPRPDPAERQYYEKLNDLASQLAEYLKSLRDPAQPGPQKVIPDERPTIFIAEPTDDLDEVHDDVKRYLQQAGLRVLPDSWYPREPGAFESAATRDLANCDVFVQLLSGSVGKRTPDVPNGYASLQLQLAESSGKPILQWRIEDLDTGKISDARHRALLERETVLAVGIEEFKRTIKERVFKKKAPAPAKPIDAFVFVDGETEDNPLAEKVCEALKQYGAGYVLPERRGTAAQIRRELERNLVECDALIVVYGTSDRGWVDEQLRQCRKALSKRERPLQAVAVFEGPPETKERLNVNLPKMLTIDCRRGLDEAALSKFLNGLGA
jgi:hypothetical protein